LKADFYQTSTPRFSHPLVTIFYFLFILALLKNCDKVIIYYSALVQEGSENGGTIRSGNQTDRKILPDKYFYQQFNYLLETGVAAFPCAGFFVYPGETMQPDHKETR
jgi:hypothetical protein